MDTTIMEVSKDGLKISLMDGSVWQPVHVGDLNKTIRWYRTQRIKILKNNKGKYELTNLDTATPR
jgi:hypothetical protein